MPGFFKAVNLLFSSNRKKHRRAIELYELASLQARQPIFYERMQVPDSVEGRFDLLSLHLILLMSHMKEQNSLLQELFDYFFSDIDLSLREMGVSDLRVGKHVKKLAKNFLGVFKTYNESFSNKEKFKKALKRNIFCNVDVRDETLEDIYQYYKDCDRLLKSCDLAQDRPIWSDVLDKKEISYAA